MNTNDANPLVDDLFYYAQQPRRLDVAAPTRTLHYAAYGWKEGRDPNAFFSTKGYLDTYGDVKAAASIRSCTTTCTAGRKAAIPRRSSTPTAILPPTRT